MWILSALRPLHVLTPIPLHDSYQKRETFPLGRGTEERPAWSRKTIYARGRSENRVAASRWSEPTTATKREGSVRVHAKGFGQGVHHISETQ